MYIYETETVHSNNVWFIYNTLPIEIFFLQIRLNENNGLFLFQSLWKYYKSVNLQTTKTTKNK